MSFQNFGKSKLLENVSHERTFFVKLNVDYRNIKLIFLIYTQGERSHIENGKRMYFLMQKPHKKFQINSS